MLKWFFEGLFYTSLDAIFIGLPGVYLYKGYLKLLTVTNGIDRFFTIVAMIVLLMVLILFISVKGYRNLYGGNDDEMP